ncbi:hypothetical protein SAMD00023353_1900050 [Rosellinia necatrix]|uniref:Uncharacterized protein n=1 Tax=Rosellinia necatrix TaxID=77044 RepID=A0A1S8A7W1_ROSNE|nr:hypothetical protein SAMD00023353_1900050 [Rosellinia necatrix]
MPSNSGSNNNISGSSNSINDNGNGSSNKRQQQKMPQQAAIRLIAERVGLAPTSFAWKFGENGVRTSQYLAYISTRLLVYSSTLPVRYMVPGLGGVRSGPNYNVGKRRPHAVKDCRMGMPESKRTMRRLFHTCPFVSRPCLEMHFRFDLTR